MWWPFKKSETFGCDHEWVKLLEREEMVFEHIGGIVDCENVQFVYVGCLKCPKTKKVESYEWHIIDEHQKARKKWRMDNERE